MKMTIEQWGAWAPGLTSVESWRAWSQSAVAPRQRDKVISTKIPAMHRRRCSHLTKMAIEVVDKAMVESVDYVVFCSQHGDVDCSLRLLKDLANKEAVSPTQFVQSVHNAPAGLLSILYHLQNNMTSIAAGNNTFAMGMLEAVTWLKTHENNRVLLVMFDEYIPAFYDSFAIDSNCQYAVALLLTNSNVSGEQMTMSMTADFFERSSELPQALSFLAWLLQNDKQPQKSSLGQVLQWEFANVA